MLTDAGDDFIFTCKETSHKALYDFINGDNGASRPPCPCGFFPRDAQARRWMEWIADSFSHRVLGARPL
jgi:hypothetical protein